MGISGGKMKLSVQWYEETTTYANPFINVVFCGFVTDLGNKNSVHLEERFLVFFV